MKTLPPEQQQLLNELRPVFDQYMLELDAMQQAKDAEPPTREDIKTALCALLMEFPEADDEMMAAYAKAAFSPPHNLEEIAVLECINSAKEKMQPAISVLLQVSSSVGRRKASQESDHSAVHPSHLHNQLARSSQDSSQISDHQLTPQDQSTSFCEGHGAQHP